MRHCIWIFMFLWGVVLADIRLEIYKAPANKSITVSEDLGLFLPHDHEVLSSQTDPTGRAILHIPWKTACGRLIVTIAQVSAVFLVENERTYRIIFPKLKQQADPQRLIPYIRTPKFLKNTDGSIPLQVRMQYFQSKNKRFWQRYSNDFAYYLLNDHSAKDSLQFPSKQTLLTAFYAAQDTGQSHSACFSDFMHFSRAQMDLQAGLPLQKIYQTYLIPEPAEYNYFFYSFFRSFYRDFLSLPSFILYEDRYLSAIKNKKSLTAVEEILASNAFMQLKAYRQLFIAMNLHDLYIKKKIDLEIFAHYRQLLSKNPLLHELFHAYDQHYFSALNPLPVALTQQLQPYAGKKVYLIFSKSYCFPCYQAAEVADGWWKKYAEKIAMVVIHLGEPDPFAYPSISLPVLYIPEQEVKNWTRSFNLAELPAYGLLNEQLQIIPEPAPPVLSDNYNISLEQYLKKLP